MRAARRNQLLRVPARFLFQLRYLPVLFCCDHSMHARCARSFARARALWAFVFVVARPRVCAFRMRGGLRFAPAPMSSGPVPFSATLENMVKIFGVDIPDGYKQAYFKVLQFANIAAADQVNLRNGPKSRFRLPSLKNRSLIVLWAPLFDSFTITRRNAWHAYWGGWPGSGFSAFIEINAPRYRAGLSLLYDPPGGLGNEILSNPSFASSADGWDLTGFEYGGGKIVVPGYSGTAVGGFAMQTIPTQSDGIFRIEIDCKIAADNVGYLTMDNTGSDLWVLIAAIGGPVQFVVAGIGVNNTDGEVLSFAGDVTVGVGGGLNDFAISAGADPGNLPLEIQRVSLRKYI